MSTRTEVENTQKCRRWTLNKKELAKLKRPKSARNEGKLFLRVRAGCNIVQNKRGKIQVDEASSLLAKGPLPDKLASALRYCITVHGGGQRDGGTVKFK